MKKVLIIFGIFLLILIIGIAVVFYQTMQASSSIKFEGINLQQIADGSYKGTYEAGLVEAEVQVEIKNHKIKDIQLLNHRNGLGQKAEKVLDEIIIEGTTEVDTISGATVSSNVIRKAVECALDFECQ